MQSSVKRSIASMSRGRTPEATMAATQATDSSMERKAASTATISGGSGTQLSQAFVTSPRVPSEPMSRLISSGPSSSSEKWAIEPSGITASRARTWWAVTP